MSFHPFLLFERHFAANTSICSTVQIRLPQPGVVIAKKFVRSAVSRNLTRRIVRESFRLSRMKLPQRDIVVRVSARLDTPDRQALRKEIDGLFARLVQ